MDFERDINMLAEYLTIERGLSRNSVAAYTSDLKDAAGFFADSGRESWRVLDSDDVLDYLQSCAEHPLKSSTIARRLISIRLLFGRLAEDGRIERDFTAVMDSPRRWKILPDFLSEKEVDRLLEAFDPGASELEMRNKLMVGDEITTIGGIIGKIISIKEETVMIETGHDRTKIRILKSAVRNVDVHAADAIQPNVTAENKKESK